MARHKCDRIRSRLTAGSSNSVIVCSITFRQRQDMSRHKCLLMAAVD